MITATEVQNARLAATGLQDTATAAAEVQAVIAEQLGELAGRQTQDGAELWAQRAETAADHAEQAERLFGALDDAKRADAVRGIDHQIEALRKRRAELMGDRDEIAAKARQHVSAAQRNSVELDLEDQTRRLLETFLDEDEFEGGCYAAQRVASLQALNLRVPDATTAAQIAAVWSISEAEALAAIDGAVAQRQKALRGNERARSSRHWLDADDFREVLRVRRRILDQRVRGDATRETVHFDPAHVRNRRQSPPAGAA